MRIVIHPLIEPQREIDVTRRLVAAIAEELWLHCGGNNDLNWIEAERHLQRIIDGSHACRFEHASACDAASTPCPARRDPRQRTGDPPTDHRWHDKKERRHVPAA